MKLMLVEDERLIRNGLMRHIPWNGLGIDEVKAAANAEEAFAVCREFVPDIVMSDIRMPGMDGIAMCRELRESYPEVEIIFATGYADKEYLKAAIDLHAVRYVEKPISPEAVSEAVSEAVNRVLAKKRQRKAYLPSLLLDSKSVQFSANGCKYFCVGLLHVDGKTDLASAGERFSEKMKQNGRPRFLMERLDHQTMGILFGNTEGIAGDKALVKEIAGEAAGCFREGEHYFLSFGTDVDCTEEITYSYRASRNGQNALSYLGWNHVVFAEDMPEQTQKMEIGKKAAESFADALSVKNEKKAEEILMDVYELLKREKVHLTGNVRYLFYSMNQMADQMRQAMYPGGKSEDDSEFFDQAETFDEMYCHVKKKLSMAFAGGEEQKTTYLLKKVMDYIQEHHSDPGFSIKILADYVYLTPTYLSNLFKKKTGITIGQYLVDVRIEHAKRLMKDPQLKFYQVSAAVGYEDANYFAKIFKKKTGLTPSEYKESLVLK